MLISDTMKLVTSSNEDEEEILEYGCLKRILPTESSYYSQFFIYSEAEKVFEKLSGLKGNDYLTNG